MYRKYLKSAKILFCFIIVCFILYIPKIGISSKVDIYKESVCNGTFTKILDFAPNDREKAEELIKMMKNRLLNILDSKSKEVLMNSFDHFVAYLDKSNAVVPIFSQLLFT